METYYYVEELPLAIEYGMSIDEFWNGDIELFYAYQKAYINKLHKQSHIQGLYISLALNITYSNMFKKNSQQSTEYPKYDVYNPFLQNINKNNNSYISKIDTSTNNNELYQIKKRIKERGKINNG